MKTSHFDKIVVLGIVVGIAIALLFSIATVAFAQSHDHGSGDKAASAAQNSAQKPDAPQAAPPKSEAQKSFDQLKTIAGEWEGPITIDPPQPQWEDGAKPLHISMRVTSRGNLIVHELQTANTPLDPTKYDHPVTVLYLDNDQFQLIHYCDAGNRPHMTGKVSADGRTFDFTFAELSGSNKFGHMHHGRFTLVDADHHIEEWTWMGPNDKPVHVRFDLHRVQTPGATIAAK